MCGAGAQVAVDQLAPQLQVTVLNNEINLNPLIGTVLTTAGIALPVTTATLQLPLVQTTLNSLAPVAVSAAALATTTIANIPVGTCASLTVAYAGATRPAQCCMSNILAVLSCTVQHCASSP